MNSPAVRRDASFGHRTRTPLPVNARRTGLSGNPTYTFNAPPVEASARRSALTRRLLYLLSALSAAGYAALYWFIVCRVPIAQPAPALLSGTEAAPIWAPFWIAPAIAALAAVVFDVAMARVPVIGTRSWGMVRELVRFLIGGFAAWCVYQTVEIQLLLTASGAPDSTVSWGAVTHIAPAALRKTVRGVLAFPWTMFLVAAIAQLRWMLARFGGLAPAAQRSRAATVVLRITTGAQTLGFALIGMAPIAWVAAIGVGAGAIAVVAAFLLGIIASGLIWWFVSFRDAHFSLSGLFFGAALMAGVHHVIGSAFFHLPADEGLNQTLNALVVSVAYRFLFPQMALAIIGVVLLGLLNLAGKRKTK